MCRKWNLLPLGTRIVIKGEEDVEGTIQDYFTDKGQTEGYTVKLEDGSLAIIALDDEIEVKQ